MIQVLEEELRLVIVAVEGLHDQRFQASNRKDTLMRETVEPLPRWVWKLIAYILVCNCLEMVHDHSLQQGGKLGSHVAQLPTIKRLNVEENEAGMIHPTLGMRRSFRSS